MAQVRPPKRPFIEPNNFVKLIKELIESEIKKNNLGVSIWQVTDIKSREQDGYITSYKCNIKHPNFKYTLDDVSMIGIGLGHMKGIMKYPNVGDFVLVAFMGEQPFILGTVFDFFSEPKDSIPLVKLDELLIIQKERGSLILMKDNNDVVVRASDENGNFDNGARLRINHDGSFKLFNKENYGIEVDKDGNMLLRGQTINATQQPGEW